MVNLGTYGSAVEIPLFSPDPRHAPWDSATLYTIGAMSCSDSDSTPQHLDLEAC